MKYNTIHYIIALLKAYGIDTIIASPGTQNSYFNYLTQEDSFFNCYSVLDERSAAYVATGLAYESQKPVVITCTGATASRNYLSAMTEAFYRRIPIIALTFIDNNSNCYNMSPQFIDRKVSQNDVKTVDVTLPQIQKPEDSQEVLTLLNCALSETMYNNCPVHIDSPSCFAFDEKVEKLPLVWKTQIYDENFEVKEEELENKNVAIFIGAHKQFSQKEENVISEFADKFGIPVFCDSTSNYYGKNKLLTARLTNMIRLKNRPDLIIDIGNVSGEYGYFSLFKNAEIWRISKELKFKNRLNKPLLKYFDCSELTFFTKMLNLNLTKQTLYDELKAISDKIKIPDLPLCNAFICQQLSKNIEKNSSLYVSILNSLRNSNFFEFDKTVLLNCNVGGFGIDGGLSTIVGQSLSNPDKMHYCLIGDSAFFYDMNILGNRHIKNNIRIILVNNRRGVEFRLKHHVCEQKIGDKADELIASANHNKGGAKGWAQSCGFKYMKAENKLEFLEQINDFCNCKSEQPILFEVFTSVEDEQNGLLKMQNYNRNEFEEKLIHSYVKIREFIQ